MRTVEFLLNTLEPGTGHDFHRIMKALYNPYSIPVIVNLKTVRPSD